MAYQPIENYGIIGDMHTCALVGMDGSIDWFCCPHFDSPSVFAAILDHKKGGRFQIAPVQTQGVKHRQFYWPDTNVLITRFLSPEGVGEVTDYMPVGTRKKNSGHRLVRRVTVVRGSMKFRMECRPAFNYARDPHELSILPEGACFQSSSLSLGLATRLPLQKDGNAAVAEFTLNEGQRVTLVLRDLEAGAGWLPDFIQNLSEHWEKRIAGFDPSIEPSIRDFLSEFARERTSRGSLELMRKARQLMSVLAPGAEEKASPGEIETFRYEHPKLCRDPREYVDRGQVFLTIEPDDPAPGYLPAAMGETGRRVCGMAVDYGHWDATLRDCVKLVTEKPGVDADYAVRLLSTNALGFY
ncbi:MAG: hypothetical protein IH793_09565, partial [Acidobacteria bacterium]|nr:hypothetical protein [Acidobacteriota bacterium]